MAEPAEPKTAYVCKQMWECEDWLELELYPSVEAFRRAPAHIDCGIVEVTITERRIICCGRPDREDNPHEDDP